MALVYSVGIYTMIPLHCFIIMIVFKLILTLFCDASLVELASHYANCELNIGVTSESRVKFVDSKGIFLKPSVACFRLF